jgi:hypothetical protein
MYLWNKILLGVIGVAALLFFYVAARTLKTHQYWAQSAQQHRQRIAQLKAENVRLLEGTAQAGQPARDGVRQLRLELDRLLVDRRRAWFHCQPKIALKRDAATAEIVLTIDQPAPLGMAAKTAVYAFEEADVRKKGRYLGEFVVSAVDQKQATLAPAAALGPRQMDNIEAAKGSWVLYEVMPRDDHELFAALGEAEKKAMLPAQSLSEYLKDGQPAAKDDPSDRVVDGKFVRPLRAYDVLLDDEQAKHVLLNDSIASVRHDKQLMEGAAAGAEKLRDACRKDIAAAEIDLKDVARQRDLVAAHRQRLEHKLAAVQALVAQLIKDNLAMAGRIAKYQFEAARRIDDRVRAMAQSGTERL